MKTTFKLFGPQSRILCAVALFAVIAFSMAACDSGFGSGGGTNPGTTNPDSTVAVTDVSLNKSSISLTVGGTETLTETITPSNATNKNVTWSSSNTTVARVSTSGTVTAVAAGTATITVTTVDGSKKANCSVTVSGGTNPGFNNYDIFVLDISQKTGWDYMVVGEDGSSIFFSVNKNNDIPTRLFLKPNKNSDDGFTILFKENGLPDKVVAKNHILYFGNFRDYKFDLAIIYPNNTIQYFYDIETDINFGAYNQGRAISFSKLTKSLGFASRAIGIGTCLVSPFFQPAIWGCASYVASEVGHIVVDMVFDGFTADVSHTIIDVIGCAGNIGNVLDTITVADSCVSALANTANLLTYMDLNLTNQKNTQVNEAIRKIDGDSLTVIPKDLLEYFLLLGIEINSGRNPPAIEGTYLAKTLQLVKSTAGSIATQWDMYVTFSKQNEDILTVDTNYTMQSENGPMLSAGTGSFIVGEGNKFTVFQEGTREQSGYTAKTVEVFSGEIAATGIRNYQWAVFMIDDRGDPLGIWIANGTGYFKRDSAGFSERVSSASVPSPSPSIDYFWPSNKTLLPGIRSRQ